MDNGVLSTGRKESLRRSHFQKKMNYKMEASRTEAVGKLTYVLEYCPEQEPVIVTVCI